MRVCLFFDQPNSSNNRLIKDVQKRSLTWILRSCLTASSRALLVASIWSSMSFSSPSSFFLLPEAEPRCFLSSSSSSSSSRTCQEGQLAALKTHHEGF